jgi:hypothetical protein
MQLNSTKLFLTVLLALLLPGLLAAQSTTNGAINGTVTDASGAILPDIPVNLKSTEKGFTNATKTNGQGFYQAYGENTRSGADRHEMRLNRLREFACSRRRRLLRPAPAHLSR